MGDGNFHTFISVDVNDSNEMINYYKYTSKLVEHSLQLNGTCTGEHGIGLGKKKYLLNQFGEDTLNLMKNLKQTIDPNNIMNPNKIF